MIETRIRSSIEAYIAAWNEPDAARRMHLLEQSCAEGLHLRTPGRRIEGRAELDALIAEYQKRRPNERALLSGPIDVQGSIFRYVGIVDGAPVPRGDVLDVGECDDDGRIRVLFTFVGAGLPSRG
jgi:hypothetical protein